jgi:predicted MFS family arabinose efflux permease
MLPVVTIEKSPSKSFFEQIIEQIDLKLLKNAAFTLFVVSNFLTSLGFNVIYNFADDLANDSKVIKDKRTYIVMSIGVSNIFGRLIIGYLGDRKWVRKYFPMNISIYRN